MPTISDYLNNLIKDKSDLVDNLNTKGVTANNNETFTTLVPKVLDIQTGIDTSDATATADDILLEKTAYVNGEKITGTCEPIDNTTITPSTETQTITGPKILQGNKTIKILGDADLVAENIKKDVNIFGVVGKLENLDTSDATATAAAIREGYTAYVNGEKITGTIPDYGEHTYIPTTENQYFEAGSYITGIQCIKGDANLIPENIKKGISIFNVEGTLQEGIDTSDATATSSDMKNGVTAYVNGEKITGDAYTINSPVTITPDTKEHYLKSGFYNGITIPGDSDLVAENIKKDIEIFGVTGTLENLDTSDATATASDILLNKTAYINGEKITGTITSLEETEYTPSAIDQTINSGQYLSGNQVIKGDMNLVAGNIRKGVTIFNIEGTYEGTSAVSENIVFDSTSMSSSNEVYNTYTETVKVSQDGAYETFENLIDNAGYQTIGAIYEESYAGINLRSANANTGFYFTIPVSITSTHNLLKISTKISNWITPNITINLINTDSIDEIPTKIKASEFVWSKTITIPSSVPTNFFEYNDLPIGDYYLFIGMPSAIGGNVATLGYLGFLGL